MDIWVCEYSLVQKCFHVDTLTRILELNRSAVEKGQDTGFVPLYIALSSEDAHAFSERWQREHPQEGGYE